MNELSRRRTLMTQEKYEKTWDYEWYYTDGMPEDNGWVKASSGNATSVMTSDGLKMSSDLNSYVTYRNPERFNANKGVIEAVVVPYVDNTAGQANRVCFGNGTSGIQIYPHNGYWRLMTSQYYSGGTPILPFNSGTTYTVRLVLNGSYGSVYINDVLIVADYDINLIFFSNNTSFWSQNQSTGFGIFKSLKLKLHRIE